MKVDIPEDATMMCEICRSIKLTLIRQDYPDISEDDIFECDNCHHKTTRSHAEDVAEYARANPDWYGNGMRDAKVYNRKKEKPFSLSDVI